MTDRNIFAIRLRSARAQLELSLYELAQLLNTGAGTVSRWENGHATPPKVSRNRILTKLDDMLLARYSHRPDMAKLCYSPHTPLQVSNVMPSGSKDD